MSPAPTERCEECGWARPHHARNCLHDPARVIAQLERELAETKAKIEELRQASTMAFYADYGEAKEQAGRLAGALKLFDVWHTARGYEEAAIIGGESPETCDALGVAAIEAGERFLDAKSKELAAWENATPPR